MGVFSGAATAAEDPPFYVRKVTWTESMLASQAALIKHLDEIAPEVKLPGKRPRVKLGRWYATGGMRIKEGGLKTPLAPEQGPVDLKAFKDEAKKRALWTEQRKWKDHVVTSLRIGKGSCQYLYRTLDAGADGQTVVYLGSGDGMAVWLNGKQLLVKDVQREAAPNQERLTLDLKKGRNDLLVKIYNHEGTAGIYFSTQARPRTMTDIFYAQIWEMLRRDFPDAASIRQMDWEQTDRIWDASRGAPTLRSIAGRYAAATKGAGAAEAKKLVAEFPKEGGDLAPVRELYTMSRVLGEMKPLLGGESVAALRRAIADLTKTYPDTYKRGAEYLAKLDAIEKTVKDLSASKTPDVKALAKAGAELSDLRAEALLANPLLDPGVMPGLLVVRRSMRSPKLGLPQNWQGNCALSKTGYDNEIAVFSPVRPGGKLTTLHKPEGGKFVGDVDLHWDAGKMLFSSIGENGRWQIFETTTDGKVRQVTKGEHNDVDNYDACYLPDERIIFGSTRCFHGVPCVGGGSQVANLFLMDARGEGVRQLTFDQDHGWYPSVLNDGRVVYTRWEYSDTPHYFTRVVMRMNPDGTGQMAYYGSNSYWPNSTFYPRAIPNDPTKFVGVISGHHGVPRMGELILFDTSKGRFEADGVVQRIPGYGKKVEPKVADGLVNSSWPRFLHPYPLSDKYFLVSCQVNAKSDWSLYLVDVFDNMLLLHAEKGYAMLEPVPFRATQRPPVIPDKVATGRKDALVYMTDIHEGPGLAGIPRGTVKKLRVYEFHYAYNRMGGHISIGIDGPWDVHRILGTVPVEKDGSAFFRVPANTPIAVQPLDEDGKAMQVMRSWFTAMPGEVLSCVGCHEQSNGTTPNRRTEAAIKTAAEITPWRGPGRGFSFKREVQPVLDKHCVSCHDGKTEGRPDFRSVAALDVDLGGKKGKKHRFTPSYVALHPYVRRPGPESDYHMRPPLEYHADGSELVQMLRKGHGRVRLDAESWERLITWIDLNVPDHGTWGEHRSIATGIQKRRAEMRKQYAGINDDPEKILTVVDLGKPVKPAPAPKKPTTPTVPGWPFSADQAAKRQAAAGDVKQSIDLGDGVKLELTLVPAGEFVMGDANGWTDEWPPSRVKIDQPYWMGTFEITNAQYALFDPTHHSGRLSHYNKDVGNQGHQQSGSKQPAIRLSWRQAMAFCEWLSERTGRTFSLPTEAQWEYACRAGTATPMNFGETTANYSKLANMADASLLALCRRDSPKWIPVDGKVKDGAIATTDVGRYAPNAWGLHDMHGNAAEWTLSTYRPYPYRAGDGRNDASPNGRKVVRGGSYYDRAKRGRSAFRLDFPSWRPVYNAGFRVVCPVGPVKVASKDARTSK